LIIRFELLDRRHDRPSFQSGAPQLDDWFKTRAHRKTNDVESLESTLRSTRKESSGSMAWHVHDVFGQLAGRACAQTSQVQRHSCIVVDAKDDNAVRFYESRGFIRLVAQPNPLFILAETVASALAASSK
jgi:hypothetical protein